MTLKAIVLAATALLLLGGCSSLSLDSLPSLPSLPTLTGDAQLLLTSVVHVQDEVDSVTHVVLDAGFCIASPVPNELHQLFLVTPPRPGPTPRPTARLPEVRATGAKGE